MNTRVPLRLTAFASGLAAALVAPAIASAAGPSPAQTAYERLASEVAAEKDPAVALAKAHMMGRLRRDVPTARAVEVAEELMAKVSSPIVSSYFAREATRARNDLGDWTISEEGYIETFPAQGCLTKFSVAGAFDNSSMEGFDAKLPPELGEVGPYDGKMVEIDWRELPGHHRMCVLNVESFGFPRSSTVVYLSARVTSPSARDARLLMGADGAYKVWVNGALAARRDVDDGLSRDDAAWKIDLEKGENEIVFKLASTQDGDTDLTARLTDAKLRPLDDIKVTAKPPSARLEDGPAPTRTGQGALASAKARAAGQGAGAIWSAWLWSRLANEDAATPWRNVADRMYDAVSGRAAGPKIELTGWEFLALADLFEEQWKRVEVLELAFARLPNDPWVALELAQAYEDELSETKRLRARAILEDLLTKDPGFLGARHALASWYGQAGLDYRSLEILRAGADHGGTDVPSYLMRLEGVERSEGDRARADVLRERVREIASFTSSVDWIEAGDLIEKGDFEAALTSTRRARSVRPWSTGWLRREVKILRALGKMDDALALTDQRLADAPGDVAMHRMRAELLFAMGRPDEAVSQLETALAYRPQDTDLSDYIAHLRPDENRFHEPWMIESDQLREIASAASPGAYHVTTLVDQEIVQVSPNGLAQTVSQRIYRANDEEGVDSAATSRVSFQSGDERVDILRVRVHKPDGTITEDYDTWTSDGSRKANTTYNDSSTVTVRANNVEPGDFVELRYRVSQVANRNFRGDYFGDISYLQGGVPVALSRYSVLYPKEWDLYFRTPSNAHTRADGQLPDGEPAPEGFKATSFELRDVPAVKTDSGQPGATEVYDYILVSNKKSYDDVGQWWWSLIEEQLIVDEAIRAAVAEATKDAKTDDEKVRGIYNYVVKNTRYLHVGLGIHGWKPYRTTTCLRNRFGDCKDKASLLKVMLDEAGIPANLVLVRTRRLGLIDDAVASMHVFNHAITYVPSLDLFLDGTAEFNGSRELTTMDQGAQALIVQDGGKTRWVTIPVDAASDNTLEQEFVVDLTGETPVVEGTITARGADAVYYRTSLEDPERRDEVFAKQLARTFPGAKLLRATYSDLTALEKPVTITFAFEGGDLLRESSSRAFVYPMGAPRDLLGAYASASKRDQDLMIRVPFAKNTTMRYRLPNDRAFGDPPKGTTLDSEFAKVDIAYERKGGELVASVTYSIKVQRVPVEKYSEFRSFMAAATAALNETVEVKEER